MTIKERFLKQQHAWMLGACYSRKHPDFHRFGGVDVSISPRWKDSVETFVNDMIDTLPRSLSERRMALRNPRRPFEPGNVEWVFAIKHYGLRAPDGTRPDMADVRARRV